MNTLIIALLSLGVIALAALVYSVGRLRSQLVGASPDAGAIRSDLQRIESGFRDEFSRQKSELTAKLDLQLDQSLQRTDALKDKIEGRLEAIRGTTEEKLRLFGDSADTRQTRLRVELLDQLTTFQGGMTMQLTGLRQEVDKQLTEMRNGNEQRLEQIRLTVSEQLQSTLEKGLADSFKVVSDRLEQVHKGLGEMGEIAASVGDLRRVLTNVKARGTWGEMQLGNLIGDILTRDQYAENVPVNPASRDFVEYAIKLPGADEESGPVWLPIDAKYPVEDFLRLSEAADKGDAEAVETAGRSLEASIRAFAKTVASKYIAPPHTTNFAFLYLPSESLYAEVVRRPGIVEGLQRDFRVSVAGPSTLTALLNSLQMGFKTLAIQAKSAEVWKVLGAVKTEFGRFSEVLTKVKKKLEEASDQIDKTDIRTRAISRKLREVETLPEAEVARLLPDAPDAAEIDAETL